MESTYSWTVRNSANCQRVRIVVGPGSLPYTTKVTFGNVFTIELNADDAEGLAEVIKLISDTRGVEHE